MLSISLLKISAALQKPKGIIVHCHNPVPRIKSVFSWTARSISTWQYPLLKSSVENDGDSANASTVSSIGGNGSLPGCSIVYNHNPHRNSCFNTSFSRGSPVSQRFFERHMYPICTIPQNTKSITEQCPRGWMGGCLLLLLLLALLQLIQLYTPVSFWTNTFWNNLMLFSCNSHSVFYIDIFLYLFRIITNQQY